MNALDLIAASAVVIAGVQVARVVLTVGVHWRTAIWNEASALTNPELDWEDRLAELERSGFSPEDQYRLLKQYYGVVVLRALTSRSERLAAVARRAGRAAGPEGRETGHA